MGTGPKTIKSPPRGSSPKASVQTVSDAAYEKLGVGKDVEQAVTDCMQDWQGAAEWALDHLPDPPQSVPWLEWAIGFVGNMLWAVTVFFPPAAPLAGAATVAAGASRATKVASLLGAAVGSSSSQIGGLIRNVGGKLDRKEAKEFLHRWFSEQIGSATDAFINDADRWATTYLWGYMVSEFYAVTGTTKIGVNYDEEFSRFYRTAKGSHALRKFVWEDFVFVAAGLTFAKQKQGLEDHLSKVFEDILKDVQNQIKSYEYSTMPGAGAGSRAPVTEVPKFQLKLNYASLGLPADVVALHENNRKKLLGVAKT